MHDYGHALAVGVEYGAKPARVKTMQEEQAMKDYNGPAPEPRLTISSQAVRVGHVLTAINDLTNALSIHLYGDGEPQIDMQEPQSLSASVRNSLELAEHIANRLERMLSDLR